MGKEIKNWYRGYVEGFGREKVEYKNGMIVIGSDCAGNKERRRKENRGGI